MPLTQWRKILSPEATHFVLMKDRQLVGTRTGLMTEARLQDFVAKAKDWLTPQSTGIDENSLVRIDCFISPGTDNIGSQHGGTCLSDDNGGRCCPRRSSSTVWPGEYR